MAFSWPRDILNLCQEPVIGYAEIIPMKRVADHSVAESEEEKEVKQKRPGRQQQLPEEKAPGLSFSTGAVDTKIFPYASWAKIYKEVIYQNPQLLQRGDAQGDWAFRQTLSLFLQEYRGGTVSCEANCGRRRNGIPARFIASAFSAWEPGGAGRPWL